MLVGFCSCGTTDLFWVPGAVLPLHTVEIVGTIFVLSLRLRIISEVAMLLLPMLHNHALLILSSWKTVTPLPFEPSLHHLKNSAFCIVLEQGP